MALLFYDGFDHSGTSATTFLKKWDGGAVGGFTTGSARTGTSVQIPANANPMKLLPVPGDVIIIGLAVRFPPTTFPLTNYLLRFQEGATIHIDINLDASSFLVVRRGATILATATANAFTTLSWYYLEVKVVIHDTAGSVACHVDGATVPFNASLTGIDTRNGGTGILDRIQLDGMNTAPQLMVDDLYLCDDAGTVNNDFLGNCVVESLLPQTGAAGDLQDFTTLGSADHAANVDENPATDDTDYNFSSTVGQQDSYNYPSLALSGSILGVQTNLYTRKTDVGARTVAPLVRLGGVTYPGTTIAPPTTYKYFPQVWETNPATGLAWTTADIAALQAGMKIVS